MSPVVRLWPFVRQWLYALLLILTALPAYAAEPAKKDEAMAAGGSAELQRLVDTLEDDTRRKAFVGDLKALIALQKKAEADDRSSVGTRLLEALSGKIDSVGTQLGRAAETILDLPRLAGWLQQGMANPEKRAEWLVLIAKLSAILAAGLIAQSIVQWLLRRPLAAIEAQRTDSRTMRMLLAILRTLLEFVGIAACLAAAYGTMTLVDPIHEARVVALAVINALIVSRVILAAAKFTFAPHIADMRLIPVSDETANYAFLWIRRLTYLTVYGFFAIEALPALGVSRSAHDLLMKLLGLLVCLLLVILVLQNRQAVASEIRGEAGPVLGQFRRRLADVWHLLAIMYLVTIFGVWALEVPGGFEFILRATLLSLVILLIAQGIVLIATRVIQRGFSLSTEQKLRFPGLEARANRYLPVLVIVTQVFIYGLAALAFLQTWGLNVVDWLSSPLGAAIVSRIVRIFMILAVALVVWELISALIERYLSATDDRGNVIQRGQRAQTLLPLLRNVVLIVIAVMATLTVLAELGVDTGPLIAGAGILGLAVGFGAQTFVKDVITGFFILVEDAVAVGDIVEVGGHSGKVEAMTIRSIQLRDVRGAVHRVPFSEVTTTTNSSKGFSFAVFNVGIAYREDVDRCMNVIREIGGEMRADAAFAGEILADMEIMGVDSLADSAVIIVARVKVRPGRQYTIQRAFNRLLKKRFDAEGIEIPFPHRTIYFGIDSQGHAPPLHVQMQEARRARPPADKTESEPLTKEPEGEQRNFKEVVSPQADSAPKKE
jgi:small conductance mechanosensitive channel